MSGDPYRQSALVVKPKSKKMFRVAYDDPTKDLYTFKNPSYHRFYWAAWLNAWWYTLFHEYANATIQVRKT